MDSEEALAKRITQDILSEIDDIMRAKGYVVIKRKSHEAKQRLVDQLRQEVSNLREQVEWADRANERERERSRYLSERLDRVIAAAASEGVSIQAINRALDEARDGV